MLKYLLKRLLHGVFSVIVVVGIVMVLIFTLLNREAIFANDPVISKKSGNSLELYQYQQWEKYGYLDLIEYKEYVNVLIKNEDSRVVGKEDEAVTLADTESGDSNLVKELSQEFRSYYEKKGYTVYRFEGKKIGRKPDANNRPMLLAVKDHPLVKRLWVFFTGVISVDNVRYVEDDIENRGLSFTMSDPLNGGLSPALMGNGTKHKYLIYFDSKFPFIHQNLIEINLGKSMVCYVGQDLSVVMSNSSLQGASIIEEKKTITGETVTTSMDLHSAQYSNAEVISSDDLLIFGDNYINCMETTNGMSKIGYSFVMGIIATILAYLLGVPLGILMALKKDKLADKIGTIYIVFIMAVPSLAYIFLFSQIGSSVFHLPTNFGLGDNASYYVLPIVSLSLPSVASLMKWIRRYMIDQMNSDYVKFARSGGLSDGEIFSKHILKNAAIPIVHGIPGSILGCITGAIITESVYAVPGTGKLLTTAINKHDNGVIIGLTFFYACLSIVSLILGDILMSIVDPRISFTSKGR